jgi:hypothetical protein
VSTDALTDILKERSPEDKAKILRELLERRMDATDPLFEVARVLELSLDLAQQVIAVAERLPTQIEGLMTEIDERFDQRLAEWRQATGDVTGAVRDAIAAAVPEIESQTRSMASEAVRAAVEQELNGARAQFTRIAAATLQQVRDEAAGRARPASVKPPRLAWAGAALGAVVLVFIGWFAGTAQHNRYAASASADIAAGRRYRAMIPHMPADVRAWVARWRPISSTHH